MLETACVGRGPLTWLPGPPQERAGQPVSTRKNWLRPIDRSRDELEAAKAGLERVEGEFAHGQADGAGQAGSG